MLKNKNFNIILAIIIAVALWAYVLGDVNPTTNVTVKDVPITLINETSLEDAGLIVLESSETTINITVSGPRTEATKVEKTDFKVEADVEALNLGTNIVRLNVKGPDNVKITNISTDKININVDRLVTETKEIQVVASGEIEGDMEPYVIDISKEQINVTGAESLVNKVSKVNAVVDATKIGNTMKTIVAKLEAVDSQGKVIGNVRLENNAVNVSVVMHHKKTVNLEVPVVKSDDSALERTINVPKTIVIKGEDSILETITSIRCEEINLNDYNESAKVTLKPIIPNGIQISTDSTNLYAEVIVKELGKTNVRVTNSNIKLINADSDFDYEIVVEDMTIEVQGKEADLIGLNATSFEITADVKGLTKGTHTVRVKIISQKNLVSIKPSTEEIKVIVK